jgi:hypothetical protein
MPPRPKPPASLAHLSPADLKIISKVLTEHHAHIPAAARALGVSRRDLNQLVAAKPKLLREAHEEMELAVMLAKGKLFRALTNGNQRQKERAYDRVMSSWEARDSPLALARPRSRRLEQAHDVVVQVIDAPIMDEPAVGEQGVDEVAVNLPVSAVQPQVVHTPWRCAPEIFDGDPSLRGAIRRPSRRNWYA